MQQVRCLNPCHAAPQTPRHELPETTTSLPKEPFPRAPAPPEPAFFVSFDPIQRYIHRSFLLL